MNEFLFNSIWQLGGSSTFLSYAFIFLAKYLVFILIIAFIWLLFGVKTKRAKVFFSSLFILSIVLSLGVIVPTINYIYPNPRPFVELGIDALIDHPASQSFPSRHMMFVVPLALSAFYIKRNVGYWFIGSILLIGFARIAVGVHWPADILAGIILGTGSFYLVKYLLEKKGISFKSN